MGLLGKILKSAMQSDDKEYECPVCGGTLVFEDYGAKGTFNVRAYKCRVCGNVVNKGMSE